jgi:hypothetical protein
MMGLFSITSLFLPPLTSRDEDFLCELFIDLV